MSENVCVRCKLSFRFRGFTLLKITRVDRYALQSQLRDRLPGVGIDPLSFELEMIEPNP